MLKRDIKYIDFDGNEAVDTCYFNLSKTELVEYDGAYARGFVNFLNSIIEAKDGATLMTEVKKLILRAYGVRSEDGKRFMKSEQISEEFTQTAAYDALFMELVQSEEAAAIFVTGILPPDLRVDQDKPILPPPTSLV
jgi:hypothetical protein